MVFQILQIFGKKMHRRYKVLLKEETKLIIKLDLSKMEQFMMKNSN